MSPLGDTDTLKMENHALDQRFSNRSPKDLLKCGFWFNMFKMGTDSVFLTSSKMMPVLVWSFEHTLSSKTLDYPSPRSSLFIARQGEGNLHLEVTPIL